MKKIYTIIVMVQILFLNLASQLPGSKSFSPYTSIDGFTYKVGDEISLAYPSKGDTFQSVFYYDVIGDLEPVGKVLDVFLGTSMSNNKKKYFGFASKQFNLFKGKIKHFNIFKNKEGEDIQIFVIDVNDNQQVGIMFEYALRSKEVISLNPEYINKQLKNTTNDFSNNETRVKSFDDNFNVKLISIEGNKSEQIVKINVVISHKLPHQKLEFLGQNDCKAYDFSGNSYDLKDISIGNKSHGDYSAYEKFPTNVPLKVTFTFRNILPEISELSFFTMNIYSKLFDDTIYSKGKKGTLEINNLKINWN